MENHRVRSARSQDAVRRNRAQLEAKCLRAQNIRRRGRIEILHVSMPHELKSRPSTSPIRLGMHSLCFGVHNIVRATFAKFIYWALTQENLLTSVCSSNHEAMRGPQQHSYYVWHGYAHYGSSQHLVS